MDDVCRVEEVERAEDVVDDDQHLLFVHLDLRRVLQEFSHVCLKQLHHDEQVIKISWVLTRGLGVLRLSQRLGSIVCLLHFKTQRVALASL